ncbi:MAG: WG repeat-containing protein [Candidatus Gastranaerophilales bacterium]|nr:WG repeat-containing protein [Candidatus Gastranaerophilales bacterium]
MKRVIVVVFLLFFIQNFAFSQNFDTEVYSEKNKFGLIQGDKKLTEAKYSKLIRLGDSSFLFYTKGKYGIISSDGEILVEPKYSQAQRFVGKYAKLGKGGKYVIFNEKGQKVIDEEYSTIEILYGKMFLVEKDYKYGLISFDGKVILEPSVQDIYMPKPSVIKILHDNVWYEIEHKRGEEIHFPDSIKEVLAKDDDFKVTNFINKPVATTGYSVVSAGDYFIKLFSSISPSYEQTIDELILNHGADTATILIKSSWLLKFPFVYVKNYVNNLKSPDNGPLADVKTNLKNKMNN